MAASVLRKNNPRFAPKGDLHRTLIERVDAYFAENGLATRDAPRMYLKSAIVLVWLAGSYAGLVFFASGWLSALLLSISLGLAGAGAGMAIMHDGAHRAYSERRGINRLGGMSLDLLGGSSYWWHWKHNVLHHTYANVHGYDDDIDMGALGRLCPHQKWRGIHRYQHAYVWALYGLLLLKWQFIDDFVMWARGRIGLYRVPRPKGWDIVVFVGGKLTFLSLAFVIPALFHTLPVVLLFYFITTFVEGLVIATVFQLAHCVSEAEFPLPENNRFGRDWAEHQLATTADFARGNHLLCWYVGGLNFQVEHHLFPKICHVHYPALSRIVEQTCKEHGVPYHAAPGIRAALRSHLNLLKRLGKGDLGAHVSAPA
jgi:linoleoyl-CoA desaturase